MHIISIQSAPLDFNSMSYRNVLRIAEERDFQDKNNMKALFQSGLQKTFIIIITQQKVLINRRFSKYDSMDCSVNIGKVFHDSFNLQLHNKHMVQRNIRKTAYRYRSK